MDTVNPTTIHAMSPDQLGPAQSAADLCTGPAPGPIELDVFTRALATLRRAGVGFTVIEDGPAMGAAA